MHILRRLYMVTTHLHQNQRSNVGKTPEFKNNST